MNEAGAVRLKGFSLSRNYLIWAHIEHGPYKVEYAPKTIMDGGCMDGGRGGDEKENMILFETFMPLTLLLNSFNGTWTHSVKTPRESERE